LRWDAEQSFLPQVLQDEWDLCASCIAVTISLKNDKCEYQNLKLKLRTGFPPFRHYAHFC
jgi:hypothetical protein